MEDAKATLEFPRDVAKEIAQYVNCGIKKINKKFVFFMERWGHGEMNIEITIHEDIIYNNGSESSHSQTVHLILDENNDFDLQGAIENFKKGKFDNSVICLNDDVLTMHDPDDESSIDNEHTKTGSYKGEYAILFKKIMLICLELYHEEEDDMREKLKELKKEHPILALKIE